MNRKEDTATVEVPDWVPSELWQQWEAHRREIRKPLTDRARRLQIAELAKLRDGGHDLAECIRASILARWQAIYPPPRPRVPASRSAETARFLGALTGGLAGVQTDRTVEAVNVERIELQRIA